MWYILDAENDGELIVGMKDEISKENFFKHLEDKTFLDSLNYQMVSKGDAFYIPSGTIHAILKGVLLAEIQQTSDITYRIYDWDRPDTNGQMRELHTDLAFDAINFTSKQNHKIEYETNINQRNLLVACPYFTTNIIEFEKNIFLDIGMSNKFTLLFYSLADKLLE